MTSTYIQDKLDEFDKQFSEEIILDQEVRMVVPGIKHFIEQSITDYHNHIVEIIERMPAEFQGDMQVGAMTMRADIIEKLQDTNPKE